MASISLGTSFRLLGRGHLTKVSSKSRFVPPTYTLSGSPLRRGFASVRPQVCGLSHNTSRSLLQPTRALPGLVFTRHYTKDAPTPTQEAASTIAPTSATEHLPDTTDNASALAETVASNLEAIHTPLQYGDFAALGLSGWSPAGIAQWTMEIINTATGMPWFWTIVAGTVFWRIVTAPFTIMGLRNSSRLQPYQGEMRNLQAEMNEAVKKNDLIQRQKAALKIREIYDKAGVNLMAGTLGPLVQIPVTFGLFFGVKWMCAAPIEQLKWSGLNFLPDLTIPDPTYVLPAILIALVNAQITVGAAEMDFQTRPGMAHLMNGFRVLSVVGFGVTASLSSGLVTALIAGSAVTILQSLALQQKSIRRWVGINNLPEKQKFPSMKESINWVISNFQKRIDDAKQVEAHRLQRARASD